jgi:hypothetical protein
MLIGRPFISLIAYALILIKLTRPVRQYTKGRLSFPFNLVLEKLLNRSVFVTHSLLEYSFISIKYYLRALVKRMFF